MRKLDTSYRSFSEEIARLLMEARGRAARSVNAILTTTYWEIGRRIVHFEQHGRWRARYGEAVVPRLSADLTRQFGRGFSERNIEQMRLFYFKWSNPQTVSAKSDRPSFPLSWSHYVLLMGLDNQTASKFYETEAFRGGWSVRQLDRQISTQFYERTLLSKNKAAMLTKGTKAKSEDRITPQEEIKDPTVLEFLDLKLNRFTHADAGQMHLYLNYARKNWMMSRENPPVGLILCAKKDQEVAHYALEGLRNKVLASEYKMTLPDTKQLAAEIQRTQRALEARLALRQSVMESKM
jgi:hypothetical protein